MPQILDKDGLRSKINSYELFFIDIWGVIHNGLQIFEDSIEVLENLKKNNKEFVLLTNAPRPNSAVIDFLKKIGLKDFYENDYNLILVSHGNSIGIILKYFLNQKFTFEDWKNISMPDMYSVSFDESNKVTQFKRDVEGIEKIFKI